MNILTVSLCFTVWRIHVNICVKYFSYSFVGFFANLLLGMKDGLEI